MLGFGNKATEYFRMINPIEHSRTKEEAKKYRVEPYVVAADIYGAGNLAGRGGWTWYTGSSSWLYEAGIKYILGLQITKGTLKLNPSIPKEWDEYQIQYKYGKSNYQIRVINSKKQVGEKKDYVVNGVKLDDDKIVLDPNGGNYDVEVFV